MHTTELTEVKKNFTPKNIEYNKIKTLLSADIRRFCKNDKVLKTLKGPSHSMAAGLDELRKVVSSLKYGEETVYAAIVLALFNDPSGLLVLKNHQRYWITHSEIEKLHVRAALMLLHNFTTEKFSVFNQGLSPDLYRELLVERSF